MEQLKPLPSNTTKRVAYLECLRAFASFFVIVNHTNSYVFQAAVPGDSTWWLSILWYYLSKTAVALYVRVSGACLLYRQDTYRQVGLRIARMLAVLVLFSYAYYLAALWQTHWDWRRVVDLPGFFYAIWRERITDSFWYLYFYIGLLLMLPLLQRLAANLQKKDLRYLLLCSFGIGGLWPLLVHYAPMLQFPQYTYAPLFSVFIGLFFAGHYLHFFASLTRRNDWLWGTLLVGSLFVASALTRLEAARLPTGAKYWFMDDRMSPSITILLCAMSLMYFFRRIQANRRISFVRRPAVKRFLLTLGRCSFGVYLLQDLLIAQTRYRIFEVLRAAIHPMVAAILWELLVYVLAALLAWLLMRVKWLQKLI